MRCPTAPLPTASSLWMVFDSHDGATTTMAPLAQVSQQNGAGYVIDWEDRGQRSTHCTVTGRPGMTHQITGASVRYCETEHEAALELAMRCDVRKRAARRRRQGVTVAVAAMLVTTTAWVLSR